MVFLASCGGKEKSSSTGWNYNDEKNGGFEKVEYTEQETGPGLVLIEGGTFSMGRTEQDITMDWAWAQVAEAANSAHTQARRFNTF